MRSGTGRSSRPGNRVFRDKPGGLVVDYPGLADRLKHALANHTESGSRGDPSPDLPVSPFSPRLRRIQIPEGLARAAARQEPPPPRLASCRSPFANRDSAFDPGATARLPRHPPATTLQTVMTAHRTRSRSRLTRRAFIQRTGLVGTATLVAPLVVPGRVLGLDGAVAPSNRIAMGFIGTGRQTTHANLPGFLHQPDAQVVAVCDVDRWRMENARKLVDQHYSRQTASGSHQSCRAFADWRDLVARDDVDAVMIGTPDHWHILMAIAALNAGKDVSCEKPLSRSVAEGRKLVEAVARNNRVFCTDSEFRAERWNRMLATMARNGKLGQLKRIITQVPPEPTLGAQPDLPVPPGLDYEMWLGPAPEKPYTLQRVHPREKTNGRPGWLLIRDYATNPIANWGAHWNDIAMWAMDTEKTGPVAVEATGKFPPKGNLWDLAQELEAHCYYANGVELLCRSGEPLIRIEGTEGWGQVVYPANVSFEPESLLEWKPGPNDLVLPSMASEKRDFLDAVQARRQPQYDAEGGHRVNSLAHLAGASMALGRRLKWDPVAETVIGDDEANEWLKPETLRAPWRI